MSSVNKRTNAVLDPLTVPVPAGFVLLGTMFRVPHLSVDQQYSEVHWVKVGKWRTGT